MKLFVAVRPSRDVLAAIEKRVARARRSMVGPRWTSEEQWHVTLQFLGGVPEERVADVSRALDPVSKVQPFPVRLGGAGAFPRVLRARVVWLGVVGGVDGMADLARAVHTALEPLGFRPEERAERDYQPHLTVARLKVPGDVSPAVDALGHEPVGGAFVVDEVTLFSSRTSSAGARYEPVTAVGLEG